MWFAVVHRMWKSQEKSCLIFPVEGAPKFDVYLMSFSMYDLMCDDLMYSKRRTSNAFHLDIKKYIKQ